MQGRWCWEVGLLSVVYEAPRWGGGSWEGGLGKLLFHLEPRKTAAQMHDVPLTLTERMLAVLTEQVVGYCLEGSFVSERCHAVRQNDFPTKLGGS